jgi:signal transduction histidine kinase
VCPVISTFEGGSEVISAEKMFEPQSSPAAAAGSAPLGTENSSGASVPRARAWSVFGSRWHTLRENPAVPYVLAVGFVVLAIVAATLITAATGRFLAFPFYAAVVAAAWLGAGPGTLSFILATMAVEDLWAPPLFSPRMGTTELPSFLVFVAFTLVCLAWGMQRRSAQRVLEVTVEQRTADLRQSNAALQVEIADRVAAQEALRDAEAEVARTLRLATVAELAAAIAHEINQPLAAIAANGGACLRSLTHVPPMLENAREAAECIVADGHRAGDVIARIRALFNKEEPDQLPVDINDIAQRVLELSRGAIERGRIVVRTELSTSPVIVMGDPVQLQQVVVNLVTNALEAMVGIADRPRVLTVRSEVDRGAAGVLAVEDSGCGLDPEQISRMFESFYTTKPDGIGVGLAISRSIIEAHGGTMWATPAMGGGASVGFTLPLVTQGVA